MNTKPRYFSPQPGAHGMSDLQHAAYSGDAAAVAELIAQGAPLDTPDGFGWTALHWNARMACTPGDRIKVAELLIDAGANINALDINGQTPLTHARICTAPAAMTKLLRKHGARGEPIGIAKHYRRHLGV